MKPEIVKKLRKFVRALLKQNRSYGIEMHKAVLDIQRRDARIKRLEQQLAPFGHVRIDPDEYNLDKIRRLTIMYDLRVIEQGGAGALYEHLLRNVRHELQRDLKL